MNEKYKILFKKSVSLIATYIEIILSALILAVIFVSIISLIIEAFEITSITEINFNVFLGDALMLVVGIEFVKLLAQYTPGRALEVLFYTITRQLLLSHTTTVELLIGIITISILFSIRKFLYVEEFATDDKYETTSFKKIFKKITSSNDIKHDRSISPHDGKNTAEIK